MAGRLVSSSMPQDAMASVDVALECAQTRELRYRLAIVGPDPLAVIRNAGGWIVDRVLAGWEVWVAVAECDDPRPVRVLGAGVLNLGSCLDSNLAARPHSMAVDTALFHTDSRIRSGLLDSLDSARLEVVLWGEQWPAELDRRVGSPVHYRMSSAARAFKARALAAAGAPGPVDAVETFRVGSPFLMADSPLSI